MDEATQIVPFVTQLGLAVALVLFFVWRDWKKDEQLQREREETDQFIRGTLLEQLEKSTKALTLISSYLDRKNGST